MNRTIITLISILFPLVLLAQKEDLKFMDIINFKDI